MAGSAAPLLSAEHAAFITSGVSTLAASRDADHRPSVARAHGCRVSPDRHRVTVFIARPHAGTVLEDIARCGAVAVVFSFPPTHRTMQFKGEDAIVRAPHPGETDGFAAYVESFADIVEPLGYTREQIRTLFASPVDDFVAVEFTPSAAFDQTPGPKAGAPMR
jgi:hypothetical protein